MEAQANDLKLSCPYVARELEVGLPEHNGGGQGSTSMDNRIDGCDISDKCMSFS
jgi:hypothetical protein